MLNSLHVPLVYDNYHILARGIVDLTEQVFIFLINKDFFELREEDVSCLDKPVHHGGVKTLLSEGTAADHSELLPV